MPTTKATTTQINFLGIRRITTVISIVLIIGSLLTLGIRGLNFGLDFTGGTVIELEYAMSADLEAIRGDLSDNGFDDAVVQNYGSANDVLVRVAPREGLDEQAVSEQVLAVLQQANPDVTLLRVDAVGAQVGGELKEKGGLALLFAVIFTAAYIAFRFEYRFAISAAAALAHDPIIILGIFSLFQIEFDLPTLAAILAVIGYSLNDTIVVFDRIKENFIKMRKASVIEIVNRSLNQMLARTLVTSLLTLLVVIALLVYGGPSIFGFSLALFIGIIVGTYSSIYIASNLAIAMGLSRKDLLAPSKREQVDDRP